MTILPYAGLNVAFTTIPFAAATKLEPYVAPMSTPVCNLYAPVTGWTLIPYSEVIVLYPGAGHIIAPPI